MSNSISYSRLHLGAQELLRQVEALIADDLGDLAHWSEHELAPVRSSLAHVEWLLAGGLEPDAARK